MNYYDHMLKSNLFRDMSVCKLNYDICLDTIKKNRDISFLNANNNDQQEQKIFKVEVLSELTGEVAQVYEVSITPDNEYGSGCETWKNRDGEYHRENDLPAIITCDGNYKCWYKNGKLHRENDLPAIEHIDYNAWYKNGKLHRLYPSPAIVWKKENISLGYNNEYWVDGKQYFQKNSKEIYEFNYVSKLYKIKNEIIDTPYLNKIKKSLDDILKDIDIIDNEIEYIIDNRCDKQCAEDFIDTKQIHKIDLKIVLSQVELMLKKLQDIEFKLNL